MKISQTLYYLHTHFSSEAETNALFKIELLLFSCNSHHIILDNFIKHLLKSYKNYLFINSFIFN